MKKFLMAALILTSMNAFASDGLLECKGTNVQINGVFLVNQEIPAQVTLTDVLTEDGKEISQTQPLTVKTFAIEEEQLNAEFVLAGDDEPFTIENAVYNSEAQGYWGTLTKENYQGHPGRVLKTDILCKIL